jgi:hypothetical protein
LHISSKRSYLLGKYGDSGRRQGDNGESRTAGKSSTTEKSRWGLMFESRSKTKKRTTDVAQALPSVAAERPTGSGDSRYYRSYEPHNPDSGDDDNDYNYYPWPNHSLNDPNSPFFMDGATLGTIRINEKMVASEELWNKDGQQGGFYALHGLYHKIEETNGEYTYPADLTDAAKEGAMLAQYEHDRREKRAAGKSSTQERRRDDYDNLDSE